MAFATTQVKVESTGASWMTTGKWTAGIGDAAGTIKVPGADVLSIEFLPNLTSGGPANPPSTSWSSSSGIATITVNSHMYAVTNGRFRIVSR